MKPANFFPLNRLLAFGLVIASAGLIGCDPQAPDLAPEGIQLLESTPVQGASLAKNVVLHLKYQWSIQAVSTRRSVYEVKAQFDRQGGGVLTWRLGSPLVERTGVDSGDVALPGLNWNRLRHPVTARLVLTETLDDSLVALVAQTSELSWSE